MTGLSQGQEHRDQTHPIPPKGATLPIPLPT